MAVKIVKTKPRQQVLTDIIHNTVSATVNLIKIRTPQKITVMILKYD